MPASMRLAATAPGRGRCFGNLCRQSLLVGLLVSQLLLLCVPQTVAAPAAASPPPAPEKDGGGLTGRNRTIVIAVVVGGGGFLLLLSLFFVWRCCCSAGADATSAKRIPDTEMEARAKSGLMRESEDERALDGHFEWTQLPGGDAVRGLEELHKGLNHTGRGCEVCGRMLGRDCARSWEWHTGNCRACMPHCTPVVGTLECTPASCSPASIDCCKPRELSRTERLRLYATNASSGGCVVQ